MLLGGMARGQDGAQVKMPDSAGRVRIIGKRFIENHSTLDGVRSLHSGREVLHAH